MVGTALVVALDHGRALRALGVTRRRFAADVLRLFRPMVASVFRHRAAADTTAADPAAGRSGRPDEEASSPAARSHPR
jgi:hypothetical protein